uniref:hypothetical protein n=1 Tax=Pseudomonas sp. TaxID=306 RepID=UPI002585FB40
LGGATPTNDLVITVTTLAGTITSDVLNQEYEVSYVPNENTYYINARTESSLASITTTDGINDTLVFANTSSGTGAGGSSTVGTYQIKIKQPSDRDKAAGYDQPKNDIAGFKACEGRSAPLPGVAASAPAAGGGAATPPWAKK